MSLAVTETAEGRTVEVTLTGTLDKEAYERLVPLTEAHIEKYGKIRLLVVMHDFHGWDAGALWEDLKFDLKHFGDIERLALVGESRWEKGMAAFCKPFTSATVKYFPHEELDQARRWLEQDD